MATLCESDECLHADVLCLKNYRDFTLAGIGNYLYIYRNQSLELTQRIFVSERIHNIYVKNDLILIKGGKKLALIKLEKRPEGISCQCISEGQCSDWVQDAIIFCNGLIGLVTAHNMFQILNLDLTKVVNVSSCDENCILYSCKIVGDSPDNVIVFSGTVFGEILIWAPFSSEKKCILQRFIGHSGAVFSIEVNISEKIISTTSDDRSFRIWRFNTSEQLLAWEQWGNLKIELVHTLYGHTARVWRSLLLSNFYVTIGEDSQLIIWKRDGVLFKKFTLHQGCGIRSVCFSEEENSLITGGEDGGINKISWEYLSSELKPKLPGKAINAENNFSARVCLVKNGFVYTTSGGCILVSGGKDKCIYNNDNFLLYCHLEVSPSGNFIALGSIKGHIVIINIENEEVLIDGKYLEGRVYSIHYLANYILTCGPNGRLNLWKEATGNLEPVKDLSLPSCKERWTTCSLMNGNDIIIGDKMGNIYVYDLNGGQDPVRSFQKIHSYLGVTHMISDNDAIFTIGRDGTLKKFTWNFSTHSNTYKLPMEWPRKIVFYKGDKLVLGFHSSNFVVWSTRQREMVASFECGGGHRSFHCDLNGDKVIFIYVKEKKIFLVDLPLNATARIREGFHGKEINSLKILDTNPAIILTGSEDTTLRISRISKPEIEALDVLKIHTSSIRVVASCFFDEDNFLLVSAGGKGQMVLWKYNTKSMKCEQLINHRLKADDGISKSVTPTSEPETRFMSVDVIEENDEFVIVAGCSDCRIRLYSYDKKNFKLLFSARYTHCVLNVAAFKMSTWIYVASAGTDGKIVFWQVTDNFNGMSKLESYRIHQSGINCIDFERIQPGKYIFVTGGDDNKISAWHVRLYQKEIMVNQLWECSSAHACQITGVKIVKNYLIATSVDQRITFWKWSNADDAFEMGYEGQRMTSVPDIQGMDAKFISNNEILVIVHGKGIDVFKYRIGFRETR